MPNYWAIKYGLIYFWDRAWLQTVARWAPRSPAKGGRGPVLGFSLALSFSPNHRPEVLFFDVKLIHADNHRTRNLG